jgi:hypothetical protein
VAKGETYDTNIYGLLVEDWRKRDAGGAVAGAVIRR